MIRLNGFIAIFWHIVLVSIKLLSNKLIESIQDFLSVNSINALLVFFPALFFMRVRFFIF